MRRDLGKADARAFNGLLGLVLLRLVTAPIRLLLAAHERVAAFRCGLLVQNCKRLDVFHSPVDRARISARRGDLCVDLRPSKIDHHGIVGLRLRALQHFPILRNYFTHHRNLLLSAAREPPGQIFDCEFLQFVDKNPRRIGTKAVHPFDVVANTAINRGA